MPLEWVPETYPRSGGLAAAGFYKLLGRPRLDPLTVLVRETAQNSWDARQSNGRAVCFSIDGWDLEPSEQEALRSEVFPGAERAKGTMLAEHLGAESLTGFYISDRNTLGLGGPLQADEADSGGIYDWVDFVLNVGKANTAVQTGGTYGFGKTISYIVSSANTVVIFSRTRFRGRVQSRFIACAIGDDFTHQRKLCTGRHWWGNSVDGIPQPVTGAAADRLASAVGMPEFEGDDLGTNLLIIAPDLGGRSEEQAMTFIAESTTWHLWPKLMKHGRKSPMDISVSWNGIDVPIPDPSERPPLHGFAQAFRAMLDGESESADQVGTRHDIIRCSRPKTDVGDLVTVPLVQRDRAAVDDGHDPDDRDTPAPAAAITGTCHHIALLRTPELVVDYLEGPAPPEGGTEWAGVFRCRPEHDGPFAASEPPTHDSWRPELLPKSPERVIVNVGLREIRAELDHRWAPRPSRDDFHPPSTSVIADELAHLVRTVEGQGRGQKTHDPREPGRGQKNAKVEFLGAGPVHYEGSVATAAHLRVTHRSASVGTRLHIGAGVALDGTTSDPDLDPELRLVEARSQGETAPLNGLKGVLEINSTEPVDVEILVARGPGTTVLFDLQAEPIEP